MIESGMKPKPIHRPKLGIISRPNVPYSAPLTPGLNRQYNTTAIGFTAQLAREFGAEYTRDQALKRLEMADKAFSLLDIVDSCTHDLDGKPIDRQRLIARLEADQALIQKARIIMMARVVGQAKQD